MLTARKLWMGLSKEGQEKVCSDFSQSWRQLDRGTRKALAQAVSFRERTFENTQPKRRAKLLRQAIPRLGHRDQHTVLSSLSAIRENLAEDFKKALSSLDATDITENAENKIKKSIDQLTGRWSVEDIWLHAGLECMFFSSLEDELSEVKEKIFKILDQTHSHGSSIIYPSSQEDIKESQESIGAINEAKDDSPELTSPDFTTLDNVLIRTIASSLNHVDGVLNLDELDDLVGELTELNDSRERSWFHRGFVDSLLQRKLKATKNGDNLSRRAWYVTGHLVASMRSLPESERPALIEKLSRQDIELLKDSKNQSAVQFLPILLKPLLEQGKVEEANDWISAHGGKRVGSIITTVLQWASSALLSEESDPGKVRSVLDTVANLFQNGIDISKWDMDPVLLNRLDLDIRYLRAISFRMEGQLNPADNEFRYLIDKEKSPARKKDLWVQRALVKIGIRSLVDLQLPADKKKRDNFVRAILSTENWLKKATKGENPSPIALVLIALPEVVSLQDGQPFNAKENLDRAIDIMQEPGVQLWESGGGSLGEEAHLLTRARFYSILLDLRTVDAVQAQGQSLVTRLQDLFQDDRFPSDLEIEAVECALLIEAPGVDELAATILNRHAHEALSHLDIVEASKRSKDFRKSLIEMLNDSKWLRKLTPDERWFAWDSLLRGCNQSSPRDTENAEHALDSLQKLARESSEISKKFIDLLHDQTNKEWSPAWEERDRDDALYHCFIDQGSISQAVNVLVTMAHRAISDRHWGQAEDLIELLTRHDPEGDNLQQLKRRLHTEFTQDDDRSDDSEILESDIDTVSIIFVGGNETQKRYMPILSKQIENETPYIRVSYHFTDWNSNWKDVVTKISNELVEADAMVLMKFMRTGLGRRLRPLADEYGTFWTPCTGCGRDSMKRSILEAARVVKLNRDQGII